MVNAKLRENGKCRVVADIDPVAYTRWKDSGMSAAYVFTSGLEIGDLRGKLNAVIDLNNANEEEKNKKNERIYFLGEKLKETSEALAQTRKELDEAKELIAKSGIKVINTEG